MKEGLIYKWTRTRLQYLHSFTRARFRRSVFAADHSSQFLLLVSVCLPCPHALAHGAAVLQGLESFGGGDANVSLGPGGEDRLGDGGEYVSGRERVRVRVKEGREEREEGQRRGQQTSPKHKKNSLSNDIRRGGVVGLLAVLVHIVSQQAQGQRAESLLVVQGSLTQLLHDLLCRDCREYVHHYAKCAGAYLSARRGEGEEDEDEGQVSTQEFCESKKA